MNKLEAKFCVELRHWIKHNFRENYGWEAKVVRDGKLYYNQKSFINERACLAMCKDHFFYKFSDLAATGTPFDGVSLVGPGYIFVQFYKPREKTFYIINITAIEEEIKAGKKYLDKKRAIEIATEEGKLK